MVALSVSEYSVDCRSSLTSRTAIVNIIIDFHFLVYYFKKLVLKRRKKSRCSWFEKSRAFTKRPPSPTGKRASGVSHKARRYHSSQEHLIFPLRARRSQWNKDRRSSRSHDVMHATSFEKQTKWQSGLHQKRKHILFFFLTHAELEVSGYFLFLLWVVIAGYWSRDGQDRWIRNVVRFLKRPKFGFFFSLNSRASPIWFGSRVLNITDTFAICLVWHISPISVTYQNLHTRATLSRFDRLQSLAPKEAPRQHTQKNSASNASITNINFFQSFNSQFLYRKLISKNSAFRSE